MTIKEELKALEESVKQMMGDTKNAVAPEQAMQLLNLVQSVIPEIQDIVLEMESFSAYYVDTLDSSVLKTKSFQQIVTQANDPQLHTALQNSIEQIEYIMPEIDENIILSADLNRLLDKIRHQQEQLQQIIAQPYPNLNPKSEKKTKLFAPLYRFAKWMTGFIRIKPRFFSEAAITEQLSEDISAAAETITKSLLTRHQSREQEEKIKARDAMAAKRKRFEPIPQTQKEKSEIPLKPKNLSND